MILAIAIPLFSTAPPMPQPANFPGRHISKRPQWIRKLVKPKMIIGSTGILNRRMVLVADVAAIQISRTSKASLVAVCLNGWKLLVDGYDVITRRIYASVSGGCRQTARLAPDHFAIDQGCRAAKDPLSQSDYGSARVTAFGSRRKWNTYTIMSDNNV